ncbi:MAG: hypothetical protein ACLP59_35170 [Bryobacteraceae bacterium]
MTIDERLERLAERHEALTQSMELFQHDMAAMRAEFNERFSRILDIVEKQAGNIDKLADLAHDHERRLERLEG